MTTPSTGERMTVKPKLARSRSFCALASASCACADFSACFDWSYSCRDTYSCANSDLIRASLACASSSVAWALATLAALCRSAAETSALSSSSSGWPFFTLSLKSTCSLSTVPDTCVPTLISTTGLSVPLAETVCVTSPFSMVASL